MSTTAPPPAATVDPHDGRRPVDAPGVLGRLAAATVLEAADVRTALTLAELVGGADEPVLLAAALAVRAVRTGSVRVDLSTAAAEVAPDDETVDLDALDLGPTSRAWPDPRSWAALLAASPLVAVGVDGPPDRPLRLLDDHLYLDRYWRHERLVVADLHRRCAADPPPVDAPVLAAGLARLFPTAAGEEGADLQRVAAASAVLRRASVVAGGPGTGKTTTLARVLALLHEQAAALGDPPPRVALAAPTGKAAARLGEAVHAEAARLDVAEDVRAALLGATPSTLHRLLGWVPGNRSRFRHHGGHQLPHSVVVVDESSMVSLTLMARLLDAVRPTARIVLVGDPRQLASVEAGAVLGDVVGPAAAGLHVRAAARPALEVAVGGPVAVTGEGPASGVADGIVVLRRVHRYGGGIATLAEAIEAGDPDAVVVALRAGRGDVEWVEADEPLDPADAPELADIRTLVLGTARRVGAAAGAGDERGALRALRSVQVLCAHRRGPTGAAAWRHAVESLLVGGFATAAGRPWYPGRPLLVTENDHGLGVYNGDTGVVVDTGGGRLRAVFERPGRVLSVRPGRLASVDSLYAMTIHKSQGSQFGQVVVVLPDRPGPLLTRELLYTAVTRAEQKVTLVGAEAVVRAAVARPVRRASGLRDALWGHAATP